MPPTSMDLSVFLRNLRTNYGQKVKNTDASEGVVTGKYYGKRLIRALYGNITQNTEIAQLANGLL